MKAKRCHALEPLADARGGHWIKALMSHVALDVVWAQVPKDSESGREQQLLDAFRARLIAQDPTRAALGHPELLPFANLEYGKGFHKSHGFSGTTVSK